MDMNNESTYGWEDSSAHLFFLSTFLRSRTADELPVSIDWKLLLGEDPSDAITQLLDDGVLEHASLSEKLSYKYKVKELKSMLEQYDLPKSGRKQDLILRLIQSDPEGMREKCDETILLKCSTKGEKLLEQSLSNESNFLTSEEISNGDLKELLKWILAAVDSEATDNAIYDALKKTLREVEIDQTTGFIPESEELLNAETSYNRGVENSNLGNYQEALDDYSKTIELDPRCAPAYFKRGVVYERLENYQYALSDYSKAIELDSQNVPAYFGRGLSYSEIGNYQEALDDYSKAIELDPKYVSAYNNRGIVYERLENYQEALKDYSKAVELDPKCVAAYNNRGIVYKRLENYQEALDDYSKAIELDPKYVLAYYNRGIVYERLENYQEALKDYSKAIELDPKYVSAYNNRGIVYEKLENYQEAREDYSKVIELDPKDASAYCNRGGVFEQLDELQNALNDYKMVSELSNDSDLLKKAKIKQNSLIKKIEN